MNEQKILQNLSTIGYSKYSLSSDGTLYYNFPSPKAIQKDRNNRFILVNDAGERKKISLKSLYRLSFNKEYSIDSITNLKNE